MQIGAQPISAADPRPMGADYHDVWPIIRQTERIEALVPRAIITVFVGMPLVLGALHGHFILGLVNAVLLFFVGGFLCRLVAVVILAPLHVVRFASVMRRLAITLDALAPDATTTTHWMAGAPGALAITPLDTLLLVDRSTDYRFISLADEEIVAVDRRVDEEWRMRTKRGSALTLGLPLGRFLFGAWTFGGRTDTTATRSCSHTVLLRYQREDDRDMRCAIIPFGPDEIGAENLKIALNRVREATVI